jgi:hypothetical protein
LTTKFCREHGARAPGRLSVNGGYTERVTLEPRYLPIIALLSQ